MSSGIRYAFFLNKWIIGEFMNQNTGDLFIDYFLLTIDYFHLFRVISEIRGY